MPSLLPTTESSAPQAPSSTRSQPNRMIVSLQVGGIFFALANVICVAILCWAWLSVKLEPKSIEVKGSAKKSIQSDMITWSGEITARDADLTKAYAKLKTDADRVADFLKAKGIPDSEITFSSITTQKIYARELLRPSPTPPLEGESAPSAMGISNGGESHNATLIAPTAVMPDAAASIAPSPSIAKAGTVITSSHRIECYILTQSIRIESQDMKRVPEVSRSVTTLIKDGVEIDSAAPSYLYTKLSELKIDMLAEATKDATTRATQIVSNANGKLGKLVEAKMGVMQINPKGSTNTSAEGVNDTSSFEKEITAIVTTRFQLD